MKKLPCSAHDFEPENQKKRDLIVDNVIDKFNKRSEIGISKYGTTLEENNLSLLSWLNHLQEELMDATLYAEKLKSELGEFVITKDSWNNADKISHNGFVYIKIKDILFRQ
jgi:D-lyxose ketol-isomerase